MIIRMVVRISLHVWVTGVRCEIVSLEKSDYKTVKS